MTNPQHCNPHEYQTNTNTKKIIIPTSQLIQTINIHASKFEFSKSLCSSIRFHSEWTYLSFRVPKNNNHWISPEKHLADEPIFVNWLGFLLAFPSLWYLSKEPKFEMWNLYGFRNAAKKEFIYQWYRTNLCPHLSNIFQHHIAVPIKCSHTAQKLSVVPAVDKHLFGAKSINMNKQIIKDTIIQIWKVAKVDTQKNSIYVTQ